MNNVLSLLGLCKKSGNLSFGSSLIEAIQSKKAKIVILANDVAKNNEKKISNKCEFYNITIKRVFTSEELSKAIGKTNVVAVSVNEEKLAKKIKESLEA